ncbi:MAG: branched-chain amino acid transport system II carrier protein [Lachnospiraceae bacterium]|nr:branched-chain amino acid transport system II carrier protein [Lachnospiraceae bacterium]
MFLKYGNSMWNALHAISDGSKEVIAIKAEEKVFTKSDIIVSGLALFAMFFGAGNLIFPPYLGMQGGTLWKTGFLCFILVEVILSCAGIYAMVCAGGSIAAMRDSVGKVPGFLLNTAAILCTGAFIAPPRTAATTYEMTVVPITDKIGLFPFSIIFFAIVFALTIRQTQIVDIIGKFLTPVLIFGIIVLILSGIWHPIGEIGPAISNHIARDGLVAGYQAMDIISVAGFTIVVQDNLVKRGCHTKREQSKTAVSVSLIAGILLSLIYGGLTYLGATASSGFGSGLEEAGLIIAITECLMGKSGVVILGVVVGFACLTTAIGLFGATASYFESITNGKISYKTGITLLTMIGIFICNFGLSTIISAAVPILSIISPPFMTTVILLLFRRRIQNKYIYKGAALGAIIFSLFITGYDYVGLFGFVKSLPFYDFGFGWLLPAVVGGMCGKYMKQR